MHTQSSSQSRLKNDTLGNTALTELYSAFEMMDLDNFRIFAEGVVMAGGGKQPRKLEICNAINDPRTTKAQALKKAQDFILAGMGLGV
jgi:hypothetical protein